MYGPKLTPTLTRVNTLCMETVADTASLTREAWIEAAFAVLVERGVDGVRVQPLARSLKVTRGSFYWHFSDLNDLLRALLDRWFEHATSAVIAAVEAGGGEASVRLLRLLEACASDDGRIELAMRAWARSDELARNALRRVDTARVAYLEDLVSQMGHSSSTAKALASITYLAWLGLYSSYTFADREARIEQMRQLHARLVVTASEDGRAPTLR
jgi:AcrR family transcriptional regulator